MCGGRESRQGKRLNRRKRGGTVALKLRGSPRQFLLQGDGRVRDLGFDFLRDHFERLPALQ